MGQNPAANPLVEQFRKGGVPRELRLMAAQGALPLKPADLAELLQILLSDPDEEVPRTAQATLLGIPAEEFLPLLKDKRTPPEVLGWGVVHRPERELREVALQNVSLTDEVIESIASTLPEELAELVVINQVRLLRRTSLLEAIESNPNLNKDQQRRLMELRQEFKVGQVEIAPVAAPPPPPPEPPAPEQEPAPEEPAAEEALLSEEEAVARLLTDDEKKDVVKLSAAQKLYRMNTAQKVVTALKGSKEERAILVRDPNKLVSMAVLGSPRLTDSEVESFAAMKNVSQEVLRTIGRNKDWTKKYTVMASLVKNPRTPLSVSLGMVPRLNPRDVKGIAVDRNVPEVVRKQAQRFLKGEQEGSAAKR